MALLPISFKTAPRLPWLQMAERVAGYQGTHGGIGHGCRRPGHGRGRHPLHCRRRAQTLLAILSLVKRLLHRLALHIRHLIELLEPGHAGLARQLIDVR